jgi:bifunctional DNA-binding transcriptional regulator/antitoxin component of YhaV-PrlF toxin-antitoxin module
MAQQQTSAPVNHVGKRGVWVIPAALRRQYNLEEGAPVTAEAVPGGILLRRHGDPAEAAVNPWETWFKVTKRLGLTLEDINEYRAEGRR